MRNGRGNEVYFSVTEKYQKGSLGGVLSTRLCDTCRGMLTGCAGTPMRPFSPDRLSVRVSKLPKRSALSGLPGYAGYAALCAAGAYGEGHHRNRFHSCSRQVCFPNISPYIQTRQEQLTKGFSPAVFLSIRRFGFRQFRLSYKLRFPFMYRSGTAYPKRLPSHAVWAELP